MKKNILTFTASISLSFFIQAQNPQLITESRLANPSAREIHKSSAGSTQSKLASSTVHDTLHYFFSKHYYRNLTTPASAPANLSFLTIKSPYTGGLNVGYCGAVFLNSTPVNVHGLEGLVMKNPGSVSASVPFRLYLCNFYVI